MRNSHHKKQRETVEERKILEIAATGDRQGGSEDNDRNSRHKVKRQGEIEERKWKRRILRNSRHRK